MTDLLLGAGVFVLTLVLVIWQPRGLGIGYSALGGAVIDLLLHIVNLHNVGTVWSIVWNATFTFVAIIIISLILDSAGFFRWIALHFARFGGGKGSRLFVMVIVLGSLIAAMYANDGAALTLTPIVVELMVELGLSPEISLAFIMASGFIADTASLPFVVSNLVNIVSADYFHIGFVRYATTMVPVDLVAVAGSLAVLLLFFRNTLPKSYSSSHLASPKEAIRDPLTFKVGSVVTLALLVGYLLSGTLGVPLSVIAGSGALVLIATASRSQRTVLSGDTPHNQIERRAIIDVRLLLKEAPWQVVLFSLGMYLVVYGLKNVGLTTHLSVVLDQFAKGGLWFASVGTGLLIAVLSSIMNNMPTVLIGALSISGTHTHGVTQSVFVYANVIGADLGPKLTPIGSLATLLWLHTLKRRGIEISWWSYIKTGFVLTVPLLLIVTTALYIRMIL